MLRLSSCNLIRRFSKTSKPIKVLVSGAAGQIAASMIPLIANGLVFGLKQKISLHLLEIPQAIKRLKGVAMEVQDCAYDLVDGIVATDDLKVACKGIDWAILFGGFSVKSSWKNFERNSLLAGNVPIFSEMGKALDKFAKKTAKVVVIANPANTNALIAMKHAPSIPKTNFTALTRLDHNRAIAKLASRLSVPNSDIKNIAVFGNHSRTQICDTSNATVDGRNLESELSDDEFLRGPFQEFLRDRFYQIVEYRGVTSSISAANAAKDHIRSWVEGTRPGEHVSMCVHSTGNPYGIRDDLIFSFPVEISKGGWRFKGGFEFGPEMKKALEITEAELLKEKEESERILPSLL